MTHSIALAICLVMAFYAPPANVDYYPLKKGSYWRYQIEPVPTDGPRVVTWRVVAVEEVAGQKRFSLAPDPRGADDEIMSIEVTDGAVVDQFAGIVFRIPPVAGDQWFAFPQKQLGLRRVVSVGIPCTAGRLSSRECFAVEGTDEALKLRWVTWYGRGIGPMRIQYFRREAPDRLDYQLVLDRFGAGR